MAGPKEASGSLHMHLPDTSLPSYPAGIGTTEEAMYNSGSMDDCRPPGAPDTPVATDSSRATQGRRRKLNSLAQRRYRAKQKEQTQGLQETRQQLASKVAELEDVKSACTSLQVLHSTLLDRSYTVIVTWAFPHPETPLRTCLVPF